MRYTKLGLTDLKVSKICLGTMTFGEQNTEEEAHHQLDYALDQGINFIDTAELYSVPPRKETQGLTEKYIGTWLARRGRRDDIILASKISGPGSHVNYLRSGPDFSSLQILEALDASLKRLKTDYLDLYQLHWPERKTNFFGRLGYIHREDDQWTDNFREILVCLDKLIKAGKIRYVGLSNETAWGTMRFLHVAEKYGLPRMVTIQNPYNLVNRSFEVGLAEIAIRETIPLLAYSPMGFGLLSGKYHLKRDLPRDRINQFKRMSRYSNQPTWEATERYLDIADKYGISLAQMALAFVNSRPFVGSNIIGATTMGQLQENIESIHVRLSEELLEDIDQVHRAISNPAP